MVSREIFWGIPYELQVGMYVAMFVSLAFFFCGLGRNLRKWKVGKKDFDVRRNVRYRLRLVMKYVLAQSRLKGTAGWFHFAGFWGFAGLFIGTVLIFLDHSILSRFDFRLLEGNLYLVFSLMTDLCGLALAIALLGALFRRVFMRPVHLSNSLADMAIIFLILTIVMSGFVIEAARIAGSGRPNWEAFSPVGYFLSGLLAGAEGYMVGRIHYMSWLGHAFLSFVLIGTIPFTKLIHIITAPVAVFFSRIPELGSLSAEFSLYEDSEREIVDNELPLGINTVSQLSWWQLVSFDTCTQCGICESLCPAYQTGKPLSPKGLVLKLTESMAGDKDSSSLPDLFTLDELASCTTCGACVRNCPIFVNHLAVITELRRNLVFEGHFDQGHEMALRRASDYGNPYAMGQVSRDTILGVLGIPKASESDHYDVLYWLGCSGYFDDRSQEIVRNLFKIMRKLNLKVAALGSEERCCGDFARRIGDEGLFQTLALENIRSLKRFKFKKLVLHCPHGFNSFKNEYPLFGGDFEIVHHSVFLNSVLEEGIVGIEKKSEKTLYHDPCYLGRYNNEFEAPREVIDRLVTERGEFAFSKERSFCCGGGGGHMWKREESGVRVQDTRLEQAVSEGAKRVITGCPFCLLMLEDAVLMKGLKGNIEIKDISELIGAAMV